MKRFAIFLTLILTSLTLLAANAEAKRLGGGSSFGKQRTVNTPPQKSPAAAPGTPAQPSAAPQPAGNKWLGPLAGLAIGAGLGALFANMGLGGGMGSLLMIILALAAVMFVFAMFRRKQAQPAMQLAGAGAPYSSASDTAQLHTSSGTPATVAATTNIPADFPVDSFLRSAKTSFIRLQAANDRKDLNDIREYTTPEMFAEVSMQMQERNDVPQKTEVVSVNAELLEVVTENDLAIASVRLSGQLRENSDAAVNFDEIWHVQKNLKEDKAVWLLAGIQQV